MKAEMVLVKHQLLTLDQVPVWTSCLVKRHGIDGTVVRFLRLDGNAGEVRLPEGSLVSHREASQYTVLKILGPLPSGNEAEPPEPVKLGELPAFVWARARYRHTCGDPRCHDGDGRVFYLHNNHLALSRATPNELTVVPGSKQWQLKITVPEGEEGDDGND